MGAGFADPLRCKWPLIKSRETQTVIVTLGSDASTQNGNPATTPLDFTGWLDTAFAGAVYSGPANTGQEIFTYTATIEGAAANGQLRATLSSTDTGKIQTAAIAAGELDLFGTDANGDRKKLIHAWWGLKPAVGR